MGLFVAFGLDGETECRGNCVSLNKPEAQLVVSAVVKLALDLCLPFIT